MATKNADISEVWAALVTFINELTKLAKNANELIELEKAKGR